MQVGQCQGFGTGGNMEPQPRPLFLHPYTGSPHSSSGQSVQHGLPMNPKQQDFYPSTHFEGLLCVWGSPSSLIIFNYFIQFP